MEAQSKPSGTEASLTVRALLVADRLSPAGLESRDLISTTPVAFRLHASGVVVLFRYGVVVMIGLGADEQTTFLNELKPRLVGEFARYEEEFTRVELCDDAGETVQPGGPICLKEFSNDRLLVGPMRWPRVLFLRTMSAGWRRYLMLSSHLRRNWQRMAEHQGAELRS